MNTLNLKNKTKVLLRGANVCDVNLWQQRRDILVEDGRIKAVEPKITPPDGTEIVDMAGYAAVMPGFIDAHVHLVTKEEDYEHAALENWARSGLTAVRDMGLGGQRSLEAYLDWVAEVNADPACSRVFTCGPFVCKKEGMGYRKTGGELKAYAADNPAEAAEVVETVLSQGCDGIKLMFGSGMFGKVFPNFGSEELKAIVEHADGYGKWVACHVFEEKFVDTLIDAGVTELAHMPTDPLSDEQIARMVQAGMIITPTLVSSVVPPLPLPGQPARNGESAGAYVPGTYFQKEKYLVASDNVRRFFQAGGTIAMGTDTMRMTELHALPGIPVLELQLLAESGLSVRDVIVSATINAAKACGAEKELGTIEPGKEASLIAVSTPLDSSFQALEKVSFVMNRGKRIVG